MGRLVSSSGGDPRKAIQAGIDRLVNKAPPGALAAATVLALEWKQLLLTPGRGRMYGDHQASAPGDPPAPDSRDLYNSIHLSEAGEKGGDVVAGVRVASDSPYIVPLEFGTRPRAGVKDLRGKRKTGRGRLGSRLGGIAPRPSARPALARAKSKMDGALVAELNTSRGTALSVEVNNG